MVKFKCPVKNAKLTSPYGMRLHPVERIMKLHAGVDLISKDGSKVPIYATADGKVRLIKTMTGGYGKYVIITHNVDGEKYESVYAHLDKFNVTLGQTVKQGDQIGTMGNTGIGTGVHLHFEIHEGTYNYGGGKYPTSKNPMNYISLTDNQKETPVNKTKEESKGDIDLSKITISEMQKNLREQAVAMVQQGYKNKKFSDKDWVKQAEDGTLTIENLIGLKILVDSK